ncbi:methyltransferase domain-containing protein [Periconia macrospinosa]|uniref:Methyltransferase domain-containing protein n=1 Tax=Periconia macrospinosa TaxID=97972 RepID=A0A2V1EAE6_9PLEO|nr:methyltransferase domain-containing protein [Periconia macrospinosa]
MVSFQKFNEAFWSLVMPWQMLYMSLAYLPGTISHLYKTSGLTAILSWKRVQDAWFSRFWSFWGPRIRIGRGHYIVALLEGRVTQARIGKDVVMPPVNGTVLDIGPGRGYWVDLYGKTDVPVGKEAVSSKKAITKVYGVEPNADSWPSLRQKVKDAGLDGIYEILPVGIEAISAASPDGTAHIEKGSVDCIVSVLCLCSIPDQEKNIKELYGYLKEGGRWYLYEHVVANKYWPMRLYQAFVNVFWPYAYGGCQLCKDTRGSLENAGKWSKIDIAQPPEEQWHFTVPHIFGTFTK